jgi:hypothetical protein
MGRNALEILGTPPHHKIRQELIPEELAQGLSASYEVGRHLISVLHGPVPRNIPSRLRHLEESTSKNGTTSHFEGAYTKPGSA